MRRFILYITLLTAFTVPCTPSSAQETVPLSLEDCINYALKHNYAIKNSRLDVLIQDAQNKQTTAAALPHINGKAEFDDNVVPQQTFFPTGSFGQIVTAFVKPDAQTDLATKLNNNQYAAIQFSPKYAGSLGLSASQTVFDGSVMVALQARKMVMQLARQNGDITEENVRYNLYKAYHALIIAHRQQGLINQSLKYARDMEHDLIVTQQNGFAEKIEVERTSVQVNNLATDSIKINNLLTVSEQVLKYQMGMDINTPIILTDTNIEAHRLDVRELLEKDKDYNRVPEFYILKTQLQLNEFNVKRYKLAALPSLNLFASTGYNYSSNAFTEVFRPDNYLGNFLAGVQLNVPIFNGFMRVNQLKEARYNVEKNLNNIDNMKLTIDFQSAQAKTSLTNAILQVQSQRRNMGLATDVLDLAQKKYKAGVGSNIEVTQAQTDNLNAQNNYFNALLDLVNAEADLKKALGLLK